MEKLHEECAVFGVSFSTDKDACNDVYNGLLAMQHRGQEGSGIAVVKDNGLIVHKECGLVSEVFNKEVMENLCNTKTAIGHNRYSTSGSNTKANVQPFIIEFLTGRIAIAHNGNVTNAATIKKMLKTFGLHFEASSDSEVIALLIAYYVVKNGDLISGVKESVSMLEGAFSLVLLCNDNTLLAIRDAQGYRPLCLGYREDGMAIASESCGLDSSNFTFLRDVLPGEIVEIRDGKIVYEEVVLKEKEPNCGLCIFEYVYFARPDSVIDKLLVYEARHEMGRILAQEYPVDADMVCGVLDSGTYAAYGYSKESKIPMDTAFIKNHYIGRSFIYPTQAQRENAVRLKLNVLKANVEGKRIVLIDDSIVRGTTSRQIVQELKNAGAKEVHMRISSPPFLFSCHYGTDIDDEKNLIANKMSLEEIREFIGADSLGFISVEGLKEACRKSSSSFCTKCFTGNSGTYRKNELEEQ